MPLSGEVSPTHRTLESFARTSSRHLGRLVDDPLEFKLPGKGEQLETCGLPFLLACLDTTARGHLGKAFVTMRAHSCKRRECPLCWPAWAAWEGRKAARRAVYGAMGMGRLVHIVVSPPQESAFGTKGEYRRLRSKATAAAKGVGYLGGCLVFHPSRCAEGGGGLLQIGGTPIDGPHFHGVVVGWNDDTAAFYRRTGWIVHRIRVLEGEDDAARVLDYCLTHAGVAKGTQALTWWGMMAYSKLHMPELVEPEFEDRCPLCEGLLARVDWVGLGDPPPKEGLVDLENVALRQVEAFFAPCGKGRRLFVDGLGPPEDRP